MNRFDLQERLDEEWPPQRIVAVCDSCGAELWDSKKAGLGHSPVKNSPAYISAEIDMRLRKHYDRSEHDEYTVDIVSRQTVRETELLDVEVTVSG